MEFYDVAAPAVVAGLVQALKKTRLISSRFLPLTSVGVGIVVGVLVDVSAGVPTMLIRGMFYGLSAVGLYETQKELRS